MKKIDRKSLILAIIVLTVALIFLAIAREPRLTVHPALTPAAQKAAQSMRDARDW